jgi:colicin import membrane protein
MWCYSCLSLITLLFFFDVLSHLAMRDDFFSLFFAVLFHVILAISYWFFLRDAPSFVLPAPQNYEVIEAELFIEQDVILTPAPPEREIEPPPPPPPPPVVIEEPDESATLALLELKKQDLAKIEAEAERKRINEQKRKEEAERKRINEQKRKEEAERKRTDEQKRKEEAERKRINEQKRKEEAERKRTDEQKRKEETERKRADEQKRKEETERKRKEAAAKAAAAKAQADANAAGKQAAKEALINQRVAQVMALVQQRVKQRWIRPPNTSNTLSCIIEVRLLPDGTVGSASVVKSSGNVAFDRSAEQAIRSASPLPVSISQNSDVFDKFRHFRFKFDASQ